MRRSGGSTEAFGRRDRTNTITLIYSWIDDRWRASTADDHNDGTWFKVRGHAPVDHSPGYMTAEGGDLLRCRRREDDHSWCYMIKQHRHVAGRRRRTGWRSRAHGGKRDNWRSAWAKWAELLGGAACDDQSHTFGDEAQGRTSTSHVTSTPMRLTTISRFPCSWSPGHGVLTPLQLMVPSLVAPRKHAAQQSTRAHPVDAGRRSPRRSPDMHHIGTIARMPNPSRRGGVSARTEGERDGSRKDTTPWRTGSTARGPDIGSATGVHRVPTKPRTRSSAASCPRPAANTSSILTPTGAGWQTQPEGNPSALALAGATRQEPSTRRGRVADPSGPWRRR